MECSTCEELQQQDHWGCGKPGKMTYKYLEAFEPYNKICPRWFAKQEFVSGIHSDLKHYKNGCLGNVNETLSYANLEYIEILDAELIKKEYDYNNKKS